jgi:transcriptional regulator with XRE-family HTH domain
MPEARNQKPRHRRSRSFPVKGDLLRACRLAHGWTQDDAATKSGLSDRLIRKAESGGPLEIQSINILAQLYTTPERRLTPDDLLVKPITPPPLKSVSSSAARAEAMVRRLFQELWNERKFSVIDELISPDCVLHAEGRELHGRAAMYQRAKDFFAAFDRFVVEIYDLTVQGDLVICRWRVRLTQTGPWHGLAPTGKPLLVRGSTWIRVADGYLAEGWDYWDGPLETALTQA